MKNQKRLKIVLLTAAVVIIAVAAAVSVRLSGGTETYIKNYLKNFDKNLHSVGDKVSVGSNGSEDEPETDYDADVSDPETDADNDEETIPDLSDGKKEIEAKNNRIVPFENASSSKYAVYKNKLICVGRNLMTVFNESGDEEWNLAVSCPEPIIISEGNYILLAEKGGKRINLMIDKKVIFTQTTEDVINYAALSSSGDVAVVTENSEYKSSVIVYNNKGELVFKGNSGSNTVMCADINSSNRRLAIARLSTEDGIKSIINIFDINRENPLKTIEIKDSLIFDMRYIGDTINVIADNMTAGISENGKILWRRDFDGHCLSEYRFAESGFKLAVFDSGAYADILVLNRNGKEKAKIKNETIPDFVDISANRIVYNNSRELVLTDFTGKNFKKYVTEQEIKKAVMLTPGTVAIIYGGSIEFCKF